MEEEKYESFQNKINDLIGDRKSWELSDDEHKKLEDIIDNDIENKY